MTTTTKQQRTKKSKPRIFPSLLPNYTPLVYSRNESRRLDIRTLRNNTEVRCDILP